MTTSISFIGAGRVTRIILEGLARKEKLPERIIVTDTSAEVLIRLQESFPKITISTGIDESVCTTDFICIALHPPAVADSLRTITRFIDRKTTVVSLAPKVKIETLMQLTGGKNPVIRMIPNAPSLVNAGYNPVTFGELCTDQVRAAFTEWMAPLGELPVVAEETLEAYAVITAMGPTYLWFQLGHLIRLGESYGLSPDESARSVFAMAEGTVRTMQESGLSLREVMDLVPAKPMSEHEETIRSLLTDSLTGMYGKLTS